MHLTSVLEMNKQFMVEFQGCEWEALNLFMKIIKRRLERGFKTPSIVVVIKVQYMYKICNSVSNSKMESLEAGGGIFELFL